ncbi:putative uncharacterized protein DDB_G0290521 isoform X2 [Selaginella moellendorffii]|uniref:putative uncharacterized protein DDB_G0290521 isoform X2 n=1 Tax=Selaginella moellendorffii TaxID=88036 RepID=UPI000D1CD62F|nr:putative uncharacterized protein DDB_G0290521 isoform X2 [Selaginella moellendorffii]|eukprot:XP_024538199.1 putative uncharacterized protein DDB_G0290521 isoform X2 [Selaginella moellendorffii]
MKAVFVALVISCLAVCSLGDDGAAEFVVRQANQAQDRCRCWLRGTTPCPGPPPPGCTESPSSSPKASPTPKTSPTPSPSPKTSPTPSLSPETSPAPSPSPPKTSPAPNPTPKASPKASGGKDHHSATP